MKKFLLTLAAAALCASAAFADATVVIKDQTPYTGGATTDAVEWTNGNFTFNPAKGDPKATAPSFNRAGDLRLYAKNTFTITTTGPEMTKIVFNISAQGLKRLTVVSADNGTIATQAKGDATVTWTGSSKNVVFTVAPEGEKAIYGTEDTKAGQLDFDKIEITGGGELGGDVPPTPEDPNFVKVNSIENGASYALVADGKYTADLFSRNYGYFSCTALPAGAGDEFKGSEAGALKFTAVAGGYTITTAAGKFMGAKAGFNTFDTTDDSADNRVWTVSFNADGTAAIVNVATGKTVAMDTQYGSFGCYDQDALEGKALPAVFKYTGGEVVPPTPNTATFELVNAVSDGEFVFVVDGKVGEAIPASSSFGRLSLVEATFDGNKVTTAVSNIIKIAAANGGYTLQDANGRYLGFDGEHKTSFQLYTEVNEYTVWAIAMTNGEAAITMTVGESTGTVGVTKGSEGTWYTNIAPSVGADEIMLPKLYKKGGSSSVETITVDQNAPVEYFNLQGIRVENPANGLYIRRQGNNVAKVYIR